VRKDKENGNRKGEGAGAGEVPRGRRRGHHCARRCECAVMQGRQGWTASNHGVRASERGHGMRKSFSSRPETRRTTHECRIVWEGL